MRGRDQTSSPAAAGRGADPRALRKALAARADRSEYLVWDRVALRAEADDSASVFGHVHAGEIVACVKRVGLEHTCWMYVHRLRRLSPRATRSGWVQESSRLGRRSLDKLSTKERTAPVVIGDRTILREATHDRSWHAVEERIAALEADALHRGGRHSVAQAPVLGIAGAAASADSASLSLHRANAQRQKETACAQQRQRLASGALAIACGRLPPSRTYWRQHSATLNKLSIVDPATTSKFHAHDLTSAANTIPTPAMKVDDVPPMLQRLLQVRLL
eukprot:COSAG02_NODE_1799_length_10896_cov_8.648421_5_plen_276_part_00